jgi:hypothetical protein
MWVAMPRDEQFKLQHIIYTFEMCKKRKMKTVFFLRRISNDVLELCVRAASRERSRWRIFPRWYRSFTLITNSTFSFTSSTIYPFSLPLSHPLNNMWYPVSVLFYHICFLFVPAREIKWPQVNKYVRDNLYINPHSTEPPQNIALPALYIFPYHQVQLWRASAV